MVALPDEPTVPRFLLAEIRMLIYGPPKIGKTNLLTGFPDMLLLATEKGYMAHTVYKIDISSWEEFKDAVKLIVKGKHKHKTIGIDTVDILYKLCADYVCEDLGITHVSDAEWGKGYDMIAAEFEREINKLFMSKYGVIFTSHLKIQDLSSTLGKVSKAIPTLSNVARRVLIPKVSVIGCMKLKTVKLDSGQFIERRIMSFKPSQVMEAGDRDGCLPEQIRTYKDAKKTYSIFEKFYADMGSSVETNTTKRKGGGRKSSGRKAVKKRSSKRS